jgi:hypothetical protein
MQHASSPAPFVNITCTSLLNRGTVTGPCTEGNNHISTVR